MRLLLVMVMVTVCSCQRETPRPPVDDVPTPEPPIAAEPEPEPVSNDDFVKVTTSLRKRASRDRKVDADGKKVSNWMATLHRGEQVTVLEPGAEWTRVRTSAESEGWLLTSSLLGAEDAAPATVLVPAQTFARPDLVAISGEPIPAGTLLFVTAKKAQFSQVDAPGRRPVWIETEKLLTDSREVAASRLATRVFALEAKGDKEAASYRDMLEKQFADTRLVHALLGEPDEPPPNPRWTSPAGFSEPLRALEYTHDDSRRDYRFHVRMSVNTSIALTLSIDGRERCRMVGRFTEDKSLLLCVVSGEVANEAQARVRLAGTIEDPAGMQREVDVHAEGLVDVYDASIEEGDDGLPQLILAVVCPWVYVTDDGVTWERRVEIIRNLDSPAKEGHQRIHLGSVTVLDGQVRLQIREEEPETSYLDQVELEIGGRKIAAVDDVELAVRDGRYRVLRYGDAVELRFDAPDERGVVDDVWIHASGYYLPDAPQ